ncbi:MAG TPA: AMP-binding protein [Candidatus Binatus sp.]|nr:AMP-binding protein [Candidatus Binatus sp.]
MTGHFPTSPAFLHFQGRRAPTAGVVFGGRRIPYGELAAAAAELADWLARRGIRPGHAVGVMAANEPALVAMLFAVWGLGAVAVPIGVRATGEETARLLEHSRASGLLSDVLRAPVARDVAAAAGVPAFACDAELPLAPRVLRRGRAVGGRTPHIAAIAYTSGTTGAPKGVLLTHDNFLWATLACSQARGDVPRSVGACLSPLTHTPVLVSHLLCRVLLGSDAVLFERFDLASVLEAVERFGITDLSLIGGMVFEVVAMGSVPTAVRRTVQKVTVGGAPTPMEAKRALAEIFSGAEIIEAYGQTESTDGVTMARGTSVFDREGTIGRANPHVVVAVAHADGSFAAAGEEGEIVIGGPTVMAGYHRDRAATAAAVRDGWLHTGDLGRRDAEGWLFVTGRLKDVIITGGENVSPVEVEEVLRAHPDVADVAVIGTPHPKWGEQVTAVVVPRPGAALDRERLSAFAGERLAGFKKPRRIEFVAALPRNAANKVQTSVLRQQFGA